MSECESTVQGSCRGGIGTGCVCTLYTVCNMGDMLYASVLLLEIAYSLFFLNKN